MYSLAGVFAYIYAVLPIITGVATFITMMLLSVHYSFWWFLILIPAITIIVAFGENIREWMEDRFEDAQDLIDKIDL
jgi:biopolymer transport protein ExbB/TolQ